MAADGDKNNIHWNVKAIPVYALLLSMILGLVATFLVVQYVNSRALEVSGGRKVPVIFAATEIPAEAWITPDMLAVRQVPEEYVQFGCIRAKEKAFLIGQKTKSPVRKGNAVLWSYIWLNALRTIAQELQPGTRAITIGITGESGVNGFITPGDRVDIFVTYYPDNSSSIKGRAVTKLLLQNVVVLAVGSNKRPAITEFENIGKGKSGSGFGAADKSVDKTPANITLAISPDEAALLTFAEQEGSIKLALRSRQDVLVEPLSDVNAELFCRFSAAKEGDMKDIAVKGYPVVYEQGVNKGSAFVPSPGFGKTKTVLPTKVDSLAVKNKLDEVEKALPVKKPCLVKGGIFGYLVILLVVLVLVLALSLRHKNLAKDGSGSGPVSGNGCQSCK